jgi:uncharacterized protein
MRYLALFLFVCCSVSNAQVVRDKPTVEVNGDAEVKVVPDRVSIQFGVETRNASLDTATAGTDAAVKKMIAAFRALGVDESDIQTDFIRVEIAYADQGRSTSIDHYTAMKGVQVTLKDVARFDRLLQTGLKSGANKIESVDFSTSELRKYRDQARAMALKAAIEKAHDLAKAGEFRIAEKPLSVNASNSSVYWQTYGRYNYYMAQNAVQNVGGGGGGGDAGDSVALGKISVSASVTMVFEIQ